MYRKYLLTYIVCLIPLLVPLICNYIVLERTGEYLPLADIVHEQQQTEFCLYGSGVHSDFYHYKLEGYTQVQPDIAVIGSSRVMQLRQQFFTKPFYNLGGSVTSIDTAEHIVDQMFAVHVPEILIIGLDFWWFLEESRFPVHTTTPPIEKQRRHLSSIALPFQWMQRKKLSFDEYRALLVQGRNSAPHCRIGMRALQEFSGFGPDGSQYYTYTYTDGDEVSTAQRFAGVDTMIGSGTHVYKHFQTVRHDQIERFTTLVNTIRNQGVDVVVFVPPIPPYLDTAIRSLPNEYAYFSELWNALDTKNLSVQNFHSPDSIPATDCDFIDTGHADHIANARIIKNIMNSSTVNTEELTALLRTKESQNRSIGSTCNKIVNPLFYRYGKYPETWKPAP